MAPPPPPSPASSGRPHSYSISSASARPPLGELASAFGPGGASGSGSSGSGGAGAGGSGASSSPRIARTARAQASASPTASPGAASPPSHGDANGTNGRARPQNERQDTAGTGTPAPGAKDEPKGRMLSCTECKRRKIKCDRECPCGPCILRNDEARCKQVIRWEAGCSLSEFQTLQTRVKELEQRMDVYERSGPPLALPPPGGAVSANAALQQAQQSAAAQPQVRREGADDDAVMMLEDYAMGNRINTTHAAARLGANGGKNPGLGAALGDAPQAEAAVLQRSADPAIDVAYRFLQLCPDPGVVRLMWSYYFDHLDWYTRCLHRHAFVEEAERVLTLSHEAAARDVRPAFLCVFFMVQCLALHLCGPEDVRSWGMDRPQAAQLCDAMFAGSQQLLWASDFIGSHQVEHLQSVILMSVYAYNLDDSDAAYALVGASIKIAQNLRLNRLDDARTAAAGRARALGTSGGTGKATLDREIGRRVWWHLCWLDYSHALAHGGAYSIHPAHNLTAEPPNINDEALTLLGDGPVVPQPINEYTTMSFTIWRLRFLALYRETIDLHNQPRGPTYNQVLDMDKKLSCLLSSLPQYFHLKIDDPESWSHGDSNRDLELLSIQLTAHNRLLRLHRPHLIRGLTNNKDQTNLSARRCIDASQAILTILRHAKVCCPMLLKVWINVYYGFGAAVVVFLALCYESDQHSRSAEEKRSAVREMADICSTASHLSAGAKNTGNLLRGLLDAELELRRAPGTKAKGKRKRGAAGAEDVGPFERLVSRVLVDATTSSHATSLSALQREPSAGGLSFEPPHKRHSTSFARSTGGGDEPLSAGGGPAGYLGSGSGNTQPHSPWGGSNASSAGGRGNSGGGVGSAGGGGWASYAPNFGVGGRSGSMPGQTPPLAGNLAGQGLTSLLDEDVFSGIFMEPGSQAPSEWGINDWEKALESFVPTTSSGGVGVSSASSVSSQNAPPQQGQQQQQQQQQQMHAQHQQQQQHHQHQQQGPPGSSHGPPGQQQSYGHGAPSGPSPASAQHFSPHYSPPMQHQR